MHFLGCPGWLGVHQPKWKAAIINLGDKSLIRVTHYKSSMHSAASQVGSVFCQVNGSEPLHHTVIGPLNNLRRWHLILSKQHEFAYKSRALSVLEVDRSLLFLFISSTPHPQVFVWGSWGWTCLHVGRGWHTSCWDDAADWWLSGTEDHSENKTKIPILITYDVIVNSRPLIWLARHYSQLTKMFTTVKNCSILPSTRPSLNWSLYCGKPISSSHPV